MPQENYMLSVYSTISGQFEEIEVCEADYNEFRRGGWSIERNNRRFRENETPFTDLKGGLDGAYENFDEFRSEQDDPALLIAEQGLLEDLQQALTSLSDAERELLHAFFVEGNSVRQVAADMGLPHMTIQSQKARLLRKLKKLMEN